jgi:nitroimidazol reductase NimA-like FMN-containing flavoprotein (pyridoxamine 5'-phosphate oxidase superfamily)
MNTTDRSQLRRLPARGSHETEAIYEILDAGFLAHVGFTVNGQPFVIPTLYGREGERLYLHGSAASRMLRALETGISACVTVVLVDGLVLARSAFHHSMNYRSVVAFGTARRLDDPLRKAGALRVISEQLIRGRWDQVRPPDEKELRATSVLEFSIEEASAKIRNGPPIDEDADRTLPVWAGVLPLKFTAGAPVPDTECGGVGVPDYIRTFCEEIDAGQRRSESATNRPKAGVGEELWTS